MHIRQWKVLVLSAAATVAVTAGLVAVSTTASAAPIEDGGQARIMAMSNDGIGYFVMPTGELRTGLFDADLYTFVAKACGNTGALCYQIHVVLGGDDHCLYYDTELGKIGNHECHATSLRYRWYIDERKNNKVRVRPASHPARCVVFDPARLPSYPYTFIEQCASRPASHARFELVPS